jgi:Tfp pilus assembly protein PilN
MNRAFMSSTSNTFLPEDYVRRKDEAKWNIISLLLFGVVMVAVVSAFVLTNRRWQSVRAEQDVIRLQFEEEAVKIASLEELEKQRAEIMDKASIVAALRDNIPRSVLMAELWRAKPVQATLLEVKLDGDRVKAEPPAADKNRPATASIRGGAAPDPNQKVDPLKIPPPTFVHRLSIEGVAETNDHVADYLSKLKASPLLREVDLQFISETTLEGTALRRFKITARLNPEAKASDVDEAEETTLFDADSTAEAEIGRSPGSVLMGLIRNKEDQP